MDNTTSYEIHSEIESILDSFRGAAEIEELKKYSVGLMLLLLEKDIKKEQITAIIMDNTSKLKIRLLELAQQVEKNNEKYRDILVDFCFNSIDKISENAARLLAKNLMLFTSKYENNTELPTAIVNTLSTWEFKKMRGRPSYIDTDWFQAFLCGLSDIKDGEIIFDPFVNDAQFFSNANEVMKNADIEYYGCAANKDTFFKARINIILQQLNNTIIINCDNLIELAFPTKKFDHVITFPQLGERHRLYDEIIQDRYDQYKYGIPSRRSSDWLYIQSAISATKETGKAIVVTSKGPLFRSNEGKIRKEILRDDILEAIIEFPARFVASTSIPIIVLIFNKQKPASLKNKILFIDANGRNDIKIEQIRDIYFNTSEVDKISYIIDSNKIETDNYSLDLGEYIRSKNFKNKLKGYVKLKDKAIEITRGVQVAPKQLEEAGNKGEKTHYFINLSHLSDGELNYDETNMIAPQMKWIKNYQILPGDLLIAARGNFKCAVAKEDIPPMIASANIIIVRLGKEYDPYVLKYFFDSIIGQRLVGQMQTGVSATNINLSKFEDILIPDISYQEQKETAKMINESIEQYHETLKNAKMILDEAKKKINRMMNLEQWEEKNGEC